jgi:hypothetical protein
MDERTVSPALWVGVLDWQGTPYDVEEDLTLQFQSTSNAGEFSLDSLNWNPDTLFILPKSTSSMKFYYKDHSPGMPFISVSEFPEKGWSDVSQQFTIFDVLDDSIPPVLSACYPPSGAVDLAVNIPLQFEILEQNPGFGIDSTSMDVIINGDTVLYNGVTQGQGIFRFDKHPFRTWVYYTPGTPYSTGTTITIQVHCQDLAVPANTLDSTYTFQVGGAEVDITLWRKMDHTGGIVYDQVSNLEMNIPAGALADTTELMSGTVQNLPQLPDTAEAIGTAYYFGPDGFVFGDSIILRIPFSQQDLDDAGVTDPTDLPGYYFSTLNGQWEDLKIAASSSSNLYIKVKQFCYLTFVHLPNNNTVAHHDENKLLTFCLESNYPNPFNPNTAMKYSIAADCHVQIFVYDLLGRLIKSLVDQHQETGSYTVKWDGTDISGKRVSSGIYFVSMKAQDYFKTIKISLIR